MKCTSGKQRRLGLTGSLRREGTGAGKSSTQELHNGYTATCVLRP